MGIVYLARDRRLGRYVAIKRLNDKALADPNLRARFLHEARAVAALNHAYIVHIYALGEDALGPYIVMEYVSGPAQTEVVRQEEGSGSAAPPPNMTLEHFISRNGPMTAEEAVSMILKIARTIVYAHSCGVIHRDLKPANILLDPTQEPKLVDFGLARITPQVGVTHVEELTAPGEKLISLGYSAPELEQDASTSDVRADIYSLGAVFYFLLTGRNPRYYREQDVPAFLREVLRRSMETEREQRYRTAQDFVRALTEAASHGRTVAPTIKTSWRCKWCDAVNPISTKFCAECGWDGSERCRECDAEIFVGQQYCPACGADCRMYEHVASIQKMIESAWEGRHFERIASIAGRLHGFEPAGPSGRKMLMDARERVEESERRVARRNRLAVLIPNELKAENYERAQAFIEEFRSLNEDASVYEEELREIPNKILRRDLARIRECVRTHDWLTARKLSSKMAAKYGNMPEYQDVRAILESHSRRQSRKYWWMFGGAALLMYMLSLPLIGCLKQEPFGPVLRVLYMPARAIAAIPGIYGLYNHFIALCDEGATIDKYFPLVEKKQVVEHPRERLPDGAEEKRVSFETSLNEFIMRRRQQDSQLLLQYRQGLAELRRTVQQEGNYEGVISVDKALDDYVQSNMLGEPQETDVEELAHLKRTMMQIREEQLAISARQIVTVAKKYTSALDELRKRYTQQGEMEVAGRVSAEIQRVKAIPVIAENEALLAKLGGTPSVVPLPSATDVANGTNFDIEKVSTVRDVLRVELDRLDRESNEALGDWPQQYVATLRTLMEDFRQSGNFNAWEAASSELARFEESSQLRAEDILEYPEALRQTQETFLLQRRAVMESCEAEKRKAYRNALAQLESLKSDLTKQGEMNAASAVNQVIRAIQSEPRYLALERTPATAQKKPTQEGTEKKDAPTSDSQE
jgi:serine/threonine protein kinase